MTDPIKQAAPAVISEGTAATGAGPITPAPRHGLGLAGRMREGAAGLEATAKARVEQIVTGEVKAVEAEAEAKMSTYKLAAIGFAIGVAVVLVLKLIF